MKIVITADLHIHPHRTHSQVTSEGIPDRLLLYEELAKDIADIGESYGAEACIIAGDLVTSEVITPAVAHVLHNFLEEITFRFQETYLIDGNHDIDPDVALRYSSILSAFATSPKMYHSSHDMVVKSGLEDLKIYLFNYKRDESDRYCPSEEADVLVAHGLVSGVTSPSGFMFKQGFDVNKLIEKYKFSVVGDIHKGELIKDRVLIPGCPIQSSFSDDPNTGIWILDTKDWSVTFEQIGNQKYHKFLTLDFDIYEKMSASEFKLAENIHLKKKKVKKTKEVKVESNVEKDVLDMFSSIVDASKIEISKDQVKRAGIELLNQIQSSTSLGPRYAIQSMQMKGFMSIQDEINIDVSSPQESEKMLFVGDNGTGKSNILSAIGWALFDEVPASKLYRGTSKIYKEEIVNDNSNEASVVLNLIRENGLTKNNIYSISRTRDKKGERTVHSSISEPFDEEGFFNFVYFDAQNRVMLLGSSPPSVQESYLSKIGGLSLISEAKVQNSSLKTNLVKELDALEADKAFRANRLIEEEAIEKEIESRIPEYKDIKTPDQLEKTIIGNFLYKHGNLLESQDREGITNISAIVDSYPGLEQSYMSLKERFKTLSEGAICHACQQPLPELTIERLKKEVMEKMKNVAPIWNSALERLDASKQAKAVLDKLNYLNTFKNLISVMDEDRMQVAGAIEGIKKLSTSIEVKKILDSVLTKELPARAMQGVADEINAKLESILKPSGVAVQINTFNYTKSGSVAPGILIEGSFDGAPLRRYVRLSGAQKRICDLALMVCLNNMYLETVGGLNLLLFDEVFAYLGSNLSEVAVNLLDASEAALKIVVTHDLRLIPHFKRRYKVYSDKGTKIKYEGK